DQASDDRRVSKFIFHALDIQIAHCAFSRKILRLIRNSESYGSVRQKVASLGDWIMLLHRERFFLGMFLTLFSALACASTISEPGFSESLVIQNPSLGNPTVLAFAPDGSNRIFVARKTGQVMIVKNGALLATPWATMAPIITNTECGLLGM